MPDREEFNLSAIQQEVQQRWEQNALFESSIMALGISQLADLCDEYSEKSKHTKLDYTEYTLNDGVGRFSTPISSYESTEEDLLITISDEIE
jgi:hypothetical protein